MDQSIPNVPIPPAHLSGICHFSLEKLQTLHGEAGLFIQKPRSRALKSVQIYAPPGEKKKIAFSST